LVAATTPLTSDQLQDALSVKIGDTEWNPGKRINDMQRLLAYCGSLIIIDEEERTVRFVHHSVRSFCLGTLDNSSSESMEWQFTTEEANVEVGETIVTYLNYGIFDNQVSTMVIPKIESSAMPTRIMETVKGNSRTTDLALNLVKLNKTSHRDIGQILAETSGKFRELSNGAHQHAFLQYAENNWIHHTKYAKDLSVYKLWCRLVHHPRYGSFPWVITESIQKVLNVHYFVPPYGHKSRVPPIRHYQASPTVVLAICHSHLLMFNHLLRGPRTAIRTISSTFILLRELSSLEDFNFEEQMFTRLLLFAIAFRQNKAIGNLLRYAQIPTETMRQLLITAVSNGNSTMTRLLLESQALSSSDTSQMKPSLIFSAVTSGSATVAHILVEYGFAKSLEDNSKALEYILSRGFELHAASRLASILLNAGILAEPMEPEMMSKLLEIIYPVNWRYGEIMQALLPLCSHGPSLELVNDHLHDDACSLGDYDTAARYLSLGAHATHAKDVIAGGKYTCIGVVLSSWTPQRSLLVLLLLNHGANINDLDSSGIPLLHRVALCGDWNLAIIMKTRGVNMAGFREFCELNNLLHSCTWGFDRKGVNFLVREGGLSLMSPYQGEKISDLPYLSSAALMVTKVWDKWKPYLWTMDNLRWTLEHERTPNYASIIEECLYGGWCILLSAYKRDANTLVEILEDLRGPIEFSETLLQPDVRIKYDDMSISRIVEMATGVASTLVQDLSSYPTRYYERMDTINLILSNDSDEESPGEYKRRMYRASQEKSDLIYSMKKLGGYFHIICRFLALVVTVPTKFDDQPTFDPDGAVQDNGARDAKQRQEILDIYVAIDSLNLAYAHLEDILHSKQDSDLSILNDAKHSSTPGLTYNKDSRPSHSCSDFVWHILNDAKYAYLSCRVQLLRILLWLVGKGRLQTLKIDDADVWMPHDSVARRIVSSSRGVPDEDHTDAKHGMANKWSFLIATFMGPDACNVVRGLVNDWTPSETLSKLPSIIRELDSEVFAWGCGINPPLSFETVLATLRAAGCDDIVDSISLEIQKKRSSSLWELPQIGPSSAEIPQSPVELSVNPPDFPLAHGTHPVRMVELPACWASCSENNHPCQPWASLATINFKDEHFESNSKWGSWISRSLNPKPNISTRPSRQGARIWKGN
jgi:hypothetical protein